MSAQVQMNKKNRREKKRQFILFRFWDFYITLEGRKEDKMIYVIKYYSNYYIETIYNHDISI